MSACVSVAPVPLWPLEPVQLWVVMPAGKVSLTCTLVAVLGPVLLTVIV